MWVDPKAAVLKPGPRCRAQGSHSPGCSGSLQNKVQFRRLRADCRTVALIFRLVAQTSIFYNKQPAL